MRFDALIQRAVYQATGDADEAVELEPYCEQYLNEGYERLFHFYSEEPFAPLTLNEDEPRLPEWAHPAIADFATFMLLRNGNPQRQQRGMTLRAAFEEAVARLLREGGQEGKRTGFVGVFP